MATKAPTAAKVPPTRSAQAVTPSPPSRKNCKVLIADDYLSMRRTIIGILKQMGFTLFTEAEDGLMAKSILDSQKIDLVISDWNMPNMTGIELLSHVRSSTTLRDIPFLIISGEAQQQNVIEAAKKKVSEYIIKPFPADTLKRKLDKIMQ
ncbi:MAG: response regulator [Deltaproteobacteria bacterium]|nr:response regulator [Deltaproteobacteria bacterium]